MVIYISGLVAQWIRRLTTDQEILGSSPGEVVHIPSYPWKSEQLIWILFHVKDCGTKKFSYEITKQITDGSSGI